MSRHNQQIFNNGYDGYELAPSFAPLKSDAAFGDWVTAIAGAVGAVAGSVGAVGAIADAPRKAAAELELAMQQGVSAERLAKLQIQLEQAKAIAARSNAQAAETTSLIPKDKTTLYVGLAAVAVVGLLGAGFFATRK